MDCSLPGSSVHGIFQAIVLEWIAISFSRGSSQPRNRTQVSRIVRQTLYHLSHQGSANDTTLLKSLSGSLSHSEAKSKSLSWPQVPVWSGYPPPSSLLALLHPLRASFLIFWHVLLGDPGTNSTLCLECSFLKHLCHALPYLLVFLCLFHCLLVFFKLWSLLLPFFLLILK